MYEFRKGPKMEKMERNLIKIDRNLTKKDQNEQKIDQKWVKNRSKYRKWTRISHVLHIQNKSGNGNSTIQCIVKMRQKLDPVSSNDD